MSLFKSIFAAVAMAFATVSLAAPVAVAQGTKVVVINEAKIMRDSKAGKDIITKVNAIEAAMVSELQPTLNQLATEGTALETKASGKTRADLLADESFKTEYNAYVQKAQKLQVDRQVASQELQLTERKAWGEFFTALRPVLQEVVNENGAQMMIDRSEIVFGDAGIDVSDAVIAKMDAAMPSVNVVRQKMPTQPAQ